MERNIAIEEISDGNTYHSRDVVAMGCNDCAGCSACCHEMCETIILDPYDIYQFELALSQSLEQMLSNNLVELGYMDGFILPHMMPVLSEDDEMPHCSFLSPTGRCGIHAYRPGFCRLFPLGRYYRDGSFTYIHQIHECHYPLEQRTPVRIREWLGIRMLSQYEDFVNEWHYFLKAVDGHFHMKEEGSKEKERICSYLLGLFYGVPYDTKQAFFPQFYERLNRAKKELSME